MIRWTTLLAGMLLVAASGCGDATGNAATPTAAGSSSTPTPTAAASYAAQVTSLCADLVPKVIAANGGVPPTTKSFLVDRPKVRAIIKAFDAEVDAIPVTAADQAAVDAFNAFRQASDKGDEQLAKAAATGKQATFEAAYDAFIHELETSGVLDDLHGVGIGCGAR